MCPFDLCDHLNIHVHTYKQTQINVLKIQHRMSVYPSLIPNILITQTSWLTIYYSSTQTKTMNLFKITSLHTLCVLLLIFFKSLELISAHCSLKCPSHYIRLLFGPWNIGPFQCLFPYA